MTVVRIPPTLRPETNGEREVFAEGETVRDLLDDLTARFPSLQGKLEFANVYVDGEDIRTLDGDETPVRDGAQVILLPAMAGGGPASPGRASPLGELQQPACGAGGAGVSAKPPLPWRGSGAASRRLPPSSRGPALHALFPLPTGRPAARRERGGERGR